MPDPINCPKDFEEDPYINYEEVERRAPSGHYCTEGRRISEISRRVDRLEGLVSQYQVLDVKVSALERAVSDIESGIKTTCEDIHKIQVTMSQNSQSRMWVERAVLAVVTGAGTYLFTHLQPVLSP